MWLSKMSPRVCRRAVPSLSKQTYSALFSPGVASARLCECTEIVLCRSLWTLLRPRTSSCILVANSEGQFWQVGKFDSGADWCFYQCRGASGQCVIGESKCFRGLGTEQSWLDSISEFDCRIVACIVACLGRQNHMYYYMAITQYIHECLF